MAEKRMFARKIVETDQFLTLSAKAQVLYFHLCLNADDEGFVNNAATIVMPMCNCDDDVLAELIQTGYVLQVYPSIMVITHWYINNNIPKDRFHSSIVPNWKSRLDLVDKIYRIKGGIK